MAESDSFEVGHEYCTSDITLIYGGWTTLAARCAMPALVKRTFESWLQLHQEVFCLIKWECSETIDVAASSRKPRVAD